MRCGVHTLLFFNILPVEAGFAELGLGDAAHGAGIGNILLHPFGIDKVIGKTGTVFALELFEVVQIAGDDGDILRRQDDFAVSALTKVVNEGVERVLGYPASVVEAAAMTVHGERVILEKEVSEDHEVRVPRT